MKYSRLLIVLAALLEFSTAARADLASIFTNAAPARMAVPRRTSIIFIQYHDLAQGDLSCYGQTNYQTPNLDRLASEGVRFTQFYNGARCCPTRASLLTGLYAHHAGIGHMMENRGEPGYRGNLNHNCATTAEVMRANGYSTMMCGKWHVTHFAKPDGDKSNWPVQRGYEKF